MTSPDTHCHLFLLCFYAPKEDNDESTFVFVFICFVSVYLKKTTMNQRLSSSFLFCFYAPKENDDEPTLVIFFCAPKEDDDKLAFVIVFFCLVSMHPKNMMMNLCSLLSFCLFL
jgi:hypothetical protein